MTYTRTVITPPAGYEYGNGRGLSLSGGYACGQFNDSDLQGAPGVPCRWTVPGLSRDDLEVKVTNKEAIAFAVNDSGDCAGWAQDTLTHQFPSKWMGGGTTRTELSRPTGATLGNLLAINNSSEVVGWCFATATRAFYWDASDTRSSLDDGGGSADAAYGINDTGQIVGYYRPSFLNLPAYWDDYTASVYEMSIFAGGDRGECRGITPAGLIVGLSGRELYETHPIDKYRSVACYWTDYTQDPVRLPLIDESTDTGSTAYAANDDGYKVGYVTDSSSVNWAVVWDPTDTIEVLESGSIDNQAHGISTGGTIFGWTSDNELTRPTLWFPPSGPTGRWDS